MDWRTQISDISNIRIARCYAQAVSKIVNRQLIGISDASERAHCGVVYLRTAETAGGVYKTLVIAETCVVPIKVTLPHLGLCVADLLS